MSRHWAFILFIAAIFAVSMLSRHRSAVTPAEEQAVRQLAWATDFSTAQALARSENKLLLMNFTGSDWCPPCKRLRKEVFSQPEFADYARENLVLLDVDFPRRKALPPEQQFANDALARQFGVQSFPTILVLVPSGEAAARFGYTPGGPSAFIRRLPQFHSKDAGP